MLRYASILAPVLPLCCSVAVAEEQQAAPLPVNHQEFILALLDLLTQTEECLAACADAASTEAALPRLRELAERARQLSAHQQTLPEPTVQDYISAHPHVGAFNKLWQAVCGHIQRLQQTQLMSPELREILQLAPAEA